MKSKFLTALIIVLAMTAGCTTAEKASTTSSDYEVTPQSTTNTQETNDTPTDDTVSDNNENIESENSAEELQSSNSESDSDSIDISADWAENVTDTVTDYDEYIIDNSDYAMSIMFTANNPVSDFKIVSLQYEDMLCLERPVIFASADILIPRYCKASTSFSPMNLFSILSKTAYRVCCLSSSLFGLTTGS